MSNESKGFGGKLWGAVKGALVETEPDTAPPKAAAPAAQPAPVEKLTLPPVELPVNGMAPDPEMIAQLQSVITKKPSAYSAFLESVKTLEFIPDEKMRLQAAIATTLREGKRTFDQIVSAIDMHIADVEGQRTLFKGVSDQRRRQEVDAPKQRAQLLRTQNEATAHEIERLQGEIAQRQQQMTDAVTEADQLDAQAAAAETDVGLVENRFGLSVDVVKTELEAKKQVLSQLGTIPNK